jgi:hypothetical protein
MGEQENKDLGTQNSSFRHDIMLALVQHVSRPAAVVFAALLLFLWLLIAGIELEALKGAGFEARFKKSVTQRNLGYELKQLRQLNPSQLQLFLIVASDRREQRISYTGPEATVENWEALKQAGLLEYKRIDEHMVDFTVTRKAHLLHLAIMENLVESIKE